MCQGYGRGCECSKKAARLPHQPTLSESATGFRVSNQERQMRHSGCGVLVAAMGILVTGGGSPAATEAAETARRASIVVRTYTQADAEGDMQAARRTAAVTFGRAGIEVGWLECALPAKPSEASVTCQTPLGWNELVVRILPGGTADGLTYLSSLGAALVDRDAGGGSIATVYTDRVRVMAQNAGVDVAVLLGRAMAHEIGHLLLGTNRHATKGLMRASWSGADLRRNLVTEWLFRSKEGEVMREAIASRY